LPTGSLIAAASRLAGRADGAERETFAAGLEEALMREAPQIDRFLWVLDTAVTLSPLPGLLGTIVGMFDAFQVLSGPGNAPTQVTGGGAQALIATASGLFVAMIGLVFFNGLVNRLANDVAQRRTGSRSAARAASRPVAQAGSQPPLSQPIPQPAVHTQADALAAMPLAIEALLLADVGVWVVGRRVVAPIRPPEPMIITLAALAPMPAPKPASKPAQNSTSNSAPTPASKPAPVMHAPALEPRHAAPVHPARVAHATPARRPPQTVVPPSHAPSPAPVPATTQQTAPTAPTTAQTAAPTETTSTPTPATAPTPNHANANFDAALRAAIQAALRFPESARREGASGRTLVAFVYRDRTVSEIRVVTSSGMGLLDHAAVAAVRDAECPPPPRGMEGKSLPEQLWIDFRLDGNG
jgi:TonB family protein